MNKELKKQLHNVLDRPRPRPLMFIGRRNGKKVYVRKQSLSYFQLLEKYPPPFNFKLPKAPPHILAKQHHLVPRRFKRKMGCYIVWGCLIAFLTLTVTIYTVAFVKSFTSPPMDLPLLSAQAPRYENEKHLRTNHRPPGQPD